MIAAGNLVVFISGLGGFDRIGIPGLSTSYFRGLRDHLLSQGITAHFPSQRAFASVAERAQHLAQYLEKLAGQRIFLIAHSMGGLDCRYVIRHLDSGKRIRGLATVGTPHRGTPLADWFFDTDGLIQWLGRRLLSPAIGDLRSEVCVRFNLEVLDRSDVVYLSYAGVRPIEEVPSIFKPWSRLIAVHAGENDSQVSLSSARWGQFKGALRADHLELAGWSFGLSNRMVHRPFDACSLYAKVLKDLLDATEQKG
jgi:triacylglycerol lipase